MWEADQAGVDPVRPFVGFALAALLCAVLTGAAASGVRLGDLVHPARPIAGADGAPAGRAGRAADVAEVTAEGAVTSAVAAASVSTLLTELAARLPGATDDALAPGRTTYVGSAPSRRDLPPRGAERLSPRSGPARR